MAKTTRQVRRSLTPQALACVTGGDATPRSKDEKLLCAAPGTQSILYVYLGND
jgi:hypothetical protein